MRQEVIPWIRKLHVVISALAPLKGSALAKWRVL
jgi:hypothetical protein